LCCDRFGKRQKGRVSRAWFLAWISWACWGKSLISERQLLGHGQKLLSRLYTGGQGGQFSHIILLHAQNKQWWQKQEMQLLTPTS
jgi:hypothetical protein